MHYYLVLECGHGLSIYRRVFSPHIGDHFKCRLCPKQPQEKVISITEKREASDGTTYNQ